MIFDSQLKCAAAKRRARRLILQAVCVFSLAFLAPGMICSSYAQKTEKPEKAERPSRRLVYKVEPEYPWDLKRAGIGGLVRLDIVISARGVVDTVTPIGGNPVLLECAARAVKKWKYAPSDAETEVLINLEFDPRR